MFTKHWYQRAVDDALDNLEHARKLYKYSYSLEEVEAAEYNLFTARRDLAKAEQALREYNEALKTKQV